MFQNWTGERVSCGRCDIGASELDAGHAFDENGVLRLVLLDADLGGLSDARLRGWLPVEDRRMAVRLYLERLDRTIEASAFEPMTSAWRWRMTGSASACRGGRRT